uniref:Transcription initiation factor TFIID subunit 12 domain-containing protein n=1 Tax=Arundo donax TaxID=35708 RepID=A0A0A8ZAZ3_ARUDO
MDAPPPAQPADAAVAPSTTSASASSSVPPPNPPPSTSTTAPSTSDSTAATPTPNPAQTLEAPVPIPAAARPPAPRMRPPYTHLASPIAMSSSSSPATAAASAFSAAVPASSPAASSMPRGGVVMGLPAPRPAQTPVGYTGFVPPPPLAHQFGSMNRGPDQPSPSPAQFRQPSPGIQNIGMVGSLNTSQMRPGAISGPQQPRPGLPSSITPIPSGGQMPGSQRPPAHALTRPVAVSSSPSPALQQTPQNAPAAFRPQQRPQLPQPRPPQSGPVIPHQQNVISAQQQQQQLPQHQLLQQQQQKQLQQSQQQSSSHQNEQNTAPKNQLQLSQQQAARTPVSMAQKPDSPATPNTAVMRSVDTATADADASETGNRLLTKRSIHELVAQIDPNEKLDPEVEDVLIDIAEDFVESVS